MPVKSIVNASRCQNILDQLASVAEESNQKQIPLLSFEKAKKLNLLIPASEHHLIATYRDKFAINKYYKTAELIAKSTDPDDIVADLAPNLQIKFSEKRKSFIIVHNRILVALLNSSNFQLSTLGRFSYDTPNTEEAFLRLTGLKNGPFNSKFRLLSGVPIGGVEQINEKVLQVKYDKHKDDIESKKFSIELDYQNAAQNLVASDSPNTMILVTTSEAGNTNHFILKFNYITRERVVIKKSLNDGKFQIVTYYTAKSASGMLWPFCRTIFLDDYLFIDQSE